MPRRVWIAVVIVLGVLVVATVGLFGCKALVDSAFPTKDAPEGITSRVTAHQAVLEREGDRLLVAAGVRDHATSGSSPTCTYAKQTLATADADLELRSALEDLGVTKRYVEYCTAVFLVGGSVGFGADHPEALLYRGTALYDPNQSCDGLMGATQMAAPMTRNWYEGFSYPC